LYLSTKDPVFEYGKYVDNWKYNLRFPEQLVISLTGFGAGITNLNEPPRALAWVRN